MPHEPLILVPGLMCDHAVWEPLMPALSPGRHCTVVDHGNASSLVTMAQQLLDAAPARFALAGHSMGARVALEVVRLAPQRVSRVALLDTGYLPRAAGAAGEEEAAKRHALLKVAQEQGVRAMAQVWVQGMVHPDRLQDAPLIDAIVDMFARKSADTFERQICALLQRPDATDVSFSSRTASSLPSCETSSRCLINNQLVRLPPSTIITCPTATGPPAAAAPCGSLPRSDRGRGRPR